MLFKETIVTPNWGSVFSRVTRKRFGQTEFNSGKLQEQLSSSSHQDQLWGPTCSPVSRTWGLNKARACSWPQPYLIYTNNITQSWNAIYLSFEWIY